MDFAFITMIGPILGLTTVIFLLAFIAEIAINLGTVDELAPWRHRADG